MCRVSKKSKGIALVTFEEAQPAEAARAALDGSFFQGRLLHVLPARPPPAVVTPAPQVCSAPLLVNNASLATSAAT